MLHRENYISISFHVDWDMIVVTVFLSILNQMKFRSVWNQKENHPHDHIPFNVKGIGILVFSVSGARHKVEFRLARIIVAWIAIFRGYIQQWNIFSNENYAPPPSTETQVVMGGIAAMVGLPAKSLITRTNRAL